MTGGLDSRPARRSTIRSRRRKMNHLTKRIASEIILRSGVLKKVGEGLVAPRNLINFWMNYELTREDIYKSRVIREIEFRGVIKKHGMMAVRNSLPREHVLLEYLEEKMAILGEYFSSLSQEKKIHPKEWNHEMRALAIELYGRSECALKALANESFTLKDESITEEAFRIYVDNGIGDCISYLSRMKVSERRMARMLELFAKKHYDFTGKSSNINSSRLEREVMEFFEKENVFFRRQVPYMDVCNTDKRYRMDFYVGNTVIEVIDEADDFIHDADYWRRLLDKQDIAAASGRDFYVISGFEDYSLGLRDITKKASVPPEAHRLRDAAVPISQLKQVLAVKNAQEYNRLIKKGHFAENTCMKGHIKARSQREYAEAGDAA